MQHGRFYEVIQNTTGWVLRRQGAIELVEFPTRRQAVRAAVAVCLDEGLPRFVVLRADGTAEELDATELSLDV